MKNLNLQGVFLNLQLQISAHKIFSCIVLALILANVYLYFRFIPMQQTQLNQQANTLKQLQAELTVAPSLNLYPPIAANEQRVKAFYVNLGSYQSSEQYLKVLFDTANKVGITLSSAEYSASTEIQGQFRRYQVTLPMKGSYLQIRQFCRDALIALPFASLDEISFKREVIANPLPEARLRFTLHLIHDSSNTPFSSSESAFE